MKKSSIRQKLIKELHMRSLFFRRALRSALVVLISVLIYRNMSLTQGYWVTLTALIVVQPTVGATLRKGLQRFIGTLLGVGIASLLLIFIHNIYVIDALVILLLFITYFFNPFSNLINYGFVVIPISITVVFMMALITPEKVNLGIVAARLYDTSLGAIIGIAGSLILFPNKVKTEFYASKKNIRHQLADYFCAILNMFLNITGATEQARSKKRAVEEAILADRQFYIERIYEIRFHKKKLADEKQFLTVSEQIAHTLFSLHHLARYPLAIDLLHMQQQALLELRDKIYYLFLQEHDSSAEIYCLLNQMQAQLVAYAKTQQQPATTWRYMAPLVSINFAIRDIIEDTKALKTFFTH